MSSPVARVVMSLAETLAPPARAAWSAAMRAEFEALAGGPGSLSWSLGCLVSATGWRVRSEAVFVLAAIAGCITAYLAKAQIFFVVVPWTAERGIVWFEIMHAVEATLVGGLCFALAFVWPRRAWLAGGVVPFVWSMGLPLIGFLALLSDSLSDPLQVWDGNPRLFYIALPFWYLAKATWAGVLGAIVGWSLRRMTQGRAARLPAKSL